MEEVEIHRSCISTNTWGILMFMGFIVVGLLYNCYGENMSPLDSVYLSVITFLTIGYGELNCRVIVSVFATSNFIFR